MARLVVTGASPLIGPAVVKGLPWLPALFGEVWMPEAVRAEVLPGRGLRGEAEIADALAAGALRVWSAPVPQLLLPDLDDGEAACIRIGLQHRGEALLLMDERAGRAVAHQSGLSVAGTAAVIGMAKARNLIAKARPIFEALHQSDFRSSAEVLRAVLARVGEG